MIHRNVKRFDKDFLSDLKMTTSQEDFMNICKKQMAIEIIDKMDIDELNKLFIIFQEEKNNEIELELILKLK